MGGQGKEAGVRASLSKIGKSLGGNDGSTDPWESPIPRDKKLEAPRLQLWKKVNCGELLSQFGQQGCDSELSVYWVDGFYIRNTIAVDFDDGGNPGAYPDFIPEGEIWIEINGDTKDTRDEEMILLHEVYEYHQLQSGEATDYEEAHGMATHVERLARKKYADPDYKGPVEGDEKDEQGSDQGEG